MRGSLQLRDELLVNSWKPHSPFIGASYLGFKSQILLTGLYVQSHTSGCPATLSTYHLASFFVIFSCKFCQAISAKLKKQGAHIRNVSTTFKTEENMLMWFSVWINEVMRDDTSILLKSGIKKTIYVPGICGCNCVVCRVYLILPSAGALKEGN